jgi:hypothetical protein
MFDYGIRIIYIYIYIYILYMSNLVYMTTEYIVNSN